MTAPVLLFPYDTPVDALRDAATAGVRLATLPPETASPRDLAAGYFHWLAGALTAPPAQPLGVPQWGAPGLPTGHRRMLERAALAVGAVAVAPLPAVPDGSTRTPAEDQANPLSHWEALGVPGTDLPRPWRGALPPPGPLGWVNRGPGAGAFRPGAMLLIGERPGVARSGQLKHRLPFVSFDGGGCAGWLAEQLESVSVPESALYWINAYDALGVPTSPAFLYALEPTHIVALGRDAERWCNANAVGDFYVVPHPQYWKRFQSRRRYPLLDVLSETATTA